MGHQAAAQAAREMFSSVARGCMCRPLETACVPYLDSVPALLQKLRFASLLCRMEFGVPFMANIVFDDLICSTLWQMTSGLLGNIASEFDGAASHIRLLPAVDF